MRVSHIMRVRYYVFLGNGDYHKPTKYDSKWVHRWTLGEWRWFIDHLVGLESNNFDGIFKWAFITI